MGACISQVIAAQTGGNTRAAGGAGGGGFAGMIMKKAGGALQKHMAAKQNLQLSRDAPTEEYRKEAADTIPGRVRMFSGCMDTQTSADVSNVASFGLPPVSEAEKAGGACTNGLLSTLKNTNDITFGALLIEMQKTLKSRGYTQVPQLSSAQNVSLRSEKFSVWNPDGQVGGRHKALLIGINYEGHSAGVLAGCVNDVKMMRDYVMSQGYTSQNMAILADDTALTNISPTGAEIIKAMGWLLAGAQSGDSLFFHYSGHGGQTKDETGDEEDGMDETLVPLDYQTNGQITDDTIFQILVGQLPAGVSLTCVFDCCHSGTIMDLPFIFSATEESCAALESGEELQMQPNAGFNFAFAKQLIGGIASGVFNQVSRAKGGGGGGIAGGSMQTALMGVASGFLKSKMGG